MDDRFNPGQLADALWNAFSTQAHAEHESDECDTCRWYRTLAVGDSERLIREYEALAVAQVPARVCNCETAHATWCSVNEGTAS